MGPAPHRTLLGFRSWLRSLRHSRLARSFATLAVLLCGLLLLSRWWPAGQAARPLGHTARAVDREGRIHVYNSETSPIVFIGGHPRSGTTLMRAMLDAHTAVRCGEETRIVPRIVQMRENWMKSENERNRLIQGGVDDRVINSAVGAFILETIAQHGEPSEVLCNKDPLTLKSGHYMADLFPNSKWLFMVRDGRAVIHSVISRKVTISGYRHDDPRQCLERWNKVVSTMNEQCTEIGPDRCMVVYYEQLVLHPRRWMEHILNFLSLPWQEQVLHHETMINQPGGVRVSIRERSSDQIIKPINLDALTQWVGTFPEEVLEEMAEVAPMLARLGYDPAANPPHYGVPDGVVTNNTKEVHSHGKEWEVRSQQLIRQMKKEDWGKRNSVEN